MYDVIRIMDFLLQTSTLDFNAYLANRMLKYDANFGF